MQKQASVEDNVHVELKKFLSWLLDARWFPETDRDYKRRIKADQKKFLGLLRKMEAYGENHPHILLARGLADLKEYGKSFAELLKGYCRTSPVTNISSSEKGQPEVASRLLCAKLIIERLGHHGSVYREMQRLLESPDSLPYPATGPKTDVRGREIRARPLRMEIKALEGAVARMEHEIKDRKPFRFSVDVILKRLYQEYLWDTRQWRLELSDLEAEMLTSLLQFLTPELRGSAQPITTAQPQRLNITFSRELLFGNLEVEPNRSSLGIFSVPLNCTSGKVTGFFNVAEGRAGDDIQVIVADRDSQVLFDSGNVTSGEIAVEGLRPGHYILAFVNRSSAGRKIRGDVTLTFIPP